MHGETVKLRTLYLLMRNRRKLNTESMKILMIYRNRKEN